MLGGLIPAVRWVQQGVLSASDGETLMPQLSRCGRFGDSVGQGQLWAQAWSLEGSRGYGTTTGAGLRGAQLRAQEGRSSLPGFCAGQWLPRGQGAGGQGQPWCRRAVPTLTGCSPAAPEPAEPSGVVMATGPADRLRNISQNQGKHPRPRTNQDS